MYAQAYLEGARSPGEISVKTGEATTALASGPLCSLTRVQGAMSDDMLCKSNQDSSGRATEAHGASCSIPLLPPPGLLPHPLHQLF